MTQSPDQVSFISLVPLVKPTPGKSPCCPLIRHNTEEALVRIDMSESHGETPVSRLIARRLDM